jgi:glucosamine--fructose-6-phosphate aminotransferase (isomerizing)
VVGIGDGEYFIGSDVQAFLSSTNKAIFVGDDEIGQITSRGVTFYDLEGKVIKKQVKELSLSAADIEKGEYEHFMLKEIYEQPKAIQNTIEGRISVDNEDVIFENFALSKDYLAGVKKIIIAACGTSWHSALVAEYYLEKYAKIPVEVEYAAEFRYRDAIIDEDDLVMTISQSGETADTLAAIGEAQSKGANVLSIVNVEGSTIARDSDAVLYTYAGPEIGVASTKAFTTQLVVLLLFTIYLADIRRVIARDKKVDILTRLRRVPTKIQKILKDSNKIEKIAEQFASAQNALYLGRGVGFPIGLEGALKLKEISYIHAEGYPAAEMKHGPIALIDENMPVVFLAFRGRRYDKIIGNIMEVKARKGKVVAIATEGNTDIKSKVDEVIYITNTKEVLSAILAVVPLQLLAYYIAVKKGCSVDQPRNLAKSVTVE